MIQKLVQCIFFDAFFNGPFQALCLLWQLKGKTMTAEVSSFISSASLHFAVVFCAWTWWQIMGARSTVQMEAPTATGASCFRVRCTHTCWLSHSAAFHLLSWKQSHYHELQDLLGQMTLCQRSTFSFFSLSSVMSPGWGRWFSPSTQLLWNPTWRGPQWIKDIDLPELVQSKVMNMIRGLENLLYRRTGWKNWDCSPWRREGSRESL